MKTYTPEQWYNLACELYELIIAEIDSESNQDSLVILYPKLVIAYEFFRLIRGEAFISLRSPDMEKRQQQMYKMEDEILKRVYELAKKLNPDDPQVVFYINESKKIFDIKKDH